MCLFYMIGFIWYGPIVYRWKANDEDIYYIIDDKSSNDLWPGEFKKIEYYRQIKLWIHSLYTLQDCSPLILQTTTIMVPINFVKIWGIRRLCTVSGIKQTKTNADLDFCVRVNGGTDVSWYGPRPCCGRYRLG